LKTQISWDVKRMQSQKLLGSKKHNTTVPVYMANEYYNSD